SHLDEICQLLKQAKFRLNASKCEVARTETHYLGHYIKQGDIRQSPDNIRGLLHTQIPRTAEEACRFLKAAEYYRKFIPRFSLIGEPLRKFVPTSKTSRKGHKATITLTDEERKSFEELKQILTTDLALRIPNTAYPFKIQTDASDERIGAVLLQVFPDGDRPMGYLSKKFTPTQRRWFATEQECYALTCSLEKWHNYLSGTKFIWETDHKSLLPLNKKSQTNKKCERWRLKIAEYDFDVKHIHGIQNSMPDYLSRSPVDDAEEDPDVKTNYIIPFSLEQLKEAQHDDLQLQDIMRTNGVHFGRDRTIEKIKKRYFWPSMNKDIANYVQSCNPRRHKLPGALKPIKPPDGVWQLLTMDFHGPISPTSKRGNKYIILLTDVLSKFVVARAIRDCSAQTAARFLKEDIITKHGTPRCILTDNGSHFTAKMMDELFQQIGVTHLYSTPYHSQTNGQIERYNSTMDAKIAALLNEQKTDWDDQLPFVTFNYNTALHATTKQIAFEMILIQELFTIILAADKAIHTWGDIEELNKFVKYQLFTAEQLLQPNTFNVQNDFKKDWRTNHPHRTIISPADEDECICHTYIGKQPNDPWSLQDALEYGCRLWLDKRMTLSPWNIGLDPMLFHLNDKQQEQRQAWILYAIKDCLAVELLMKAKANHPRPHLMQPSVRVPCEPPSEDESDIEAATPFTPILPINRFSTPTV
ncbi:unnamed protein product, partial [Didymodactylos carnosus]